MPHWKLKVTVQRLLSVLPFGEQANHAMQVVRDHAMRDSQARSLRRRTSEVGSALRRVSGHISLDGARVVEVGTGWTPLPTMLLYLCGAGSIVTFDVARHVRYRRVRTMLEVLGSDVEHCSRSLGVPAAQVRDRLDRLKSATSVQGVFRKANIDYRAPGDATATGISERTVDLFFSYSVLEYVPVDVLHGICREAGRVLKRTGRFYAFIGCLDDYASFDKRIHRLNYLKFSDAQWARIAMNRIQYINRLREPEYVEVLETHGGRIETTRHTLEPADVENVRAMDVADRFSRFTPEQNAVVRTELIASFPALGRERGGEAR